MKQTFPVIDPAVTSRNILRLRRCKGLSVRQIQAWFNFEEPRAIYKWQSGQSLPSVDNLYALSVLLNVPMGEIIVGKYDRGTGDGAGGQWTLETVPRCIWNPILQESGAKSTVL